MATIRLNNNNNVVSLLILALAIVYLLLSYVFQSFNIFNWNTYGIIAYCINLFTFILYMSTRKSNEEN